MLPIAAVAILFACLLDPILWTLALCGVLLGRKLGWPIWGVVAAGAVLATLGSLLLLSIINPDRDPGFFSLGVRFTASAIAAGVMLVILRAFARRKPS